MNQQTLVHLHSVAEDCANEGSAIWRAVQELRDHTTYCPHVFRTNQTANVSFLSCEFHRSQKPRNDHRAINRGPALCLAPQLIKDSIDKRGERERNQLILKHYFLLCMLLHQCVSRSWCSEVDRRHHVPSKHQEPPTQWHCFTSRHNRILSYTAVRTSITATSSLYRTWWACMSSFIRASQAIIFSWNCCTLPPSQFISDGLKICNWLPARLQLLFLFCKQTADANVLTQPQTSITTYRSKPTYTSMQYSPS